MTICLWFKSSSPHAASLISLYEMTQKSGPGALGKAIALPGHRTSSWPTMAWTRTQTEEKDINFSHCCNNGPHKGEGVNYLLTPEGFI